MHDGLHHTQQSRVQPILTNMNDFDKAELQRGKLRARKAFAEFIRKEYGIEDRVTLNLMHVLDQLGCVKRKSPERVLIRKHYFEILRKNDGKVRETMAELSFRFGVSYQFVSQIVYDKHHPIAKVTDLEQDKEKKK